MLSAKEYYTMLVHGGVSPEEAEAAVRMAYPQPFPEVRMPINNTTYSAPSSSVPSSSSKSPVAVPTKKSTKDSSKSASNSTSDEIDLLDKGTQQNWPTLQPLQPAQSTQQMYRPTNMAAQRRLFNSDPSTLGGKVGNWANALITPDAMGLGLIRNLIGIGPGNQVRDAQGNIINPGLIGLIGNLFSGSGSQSNTQPAPSSYVPATSMNAGMPLDPAGINVSPIDGSIIPATAMTTPYDWGYGNGMGTGMLGGTGTIYNRWGA